VLRLISRLVVGGPAHHVCLLTARLEPCLFSSWLAHGQSAHGERSNLELAHQFGIEPISIAALKRQPGLADFRALLQIRRLLHDIRPHLIHTHTAKAGGLGRLAGLLGRPFGGDRPRLIHTFHGHVFNGYFGRYASRAAVIAERRLAHLSDAIVVVSERVKREITDKYRVAPPAKVHVVPLGFDFGWTGRIERQRGWLRARFGIPAGSPIIGNVGRLTEVKNLPLMLEGFRRFALGSDREAHLVLFGDGTMRTALEAQAQRAGIAQQVHFAGWELDRARIYSDLDAVCLTSINEGTPVALIEAIAAGVPVVATDVGGVRDVVADGIDGEVIPSHDVDALVAAVRRIASRGPICESRRDSLRRAFSVERMVRDITTLYQQVLKD
jgi:glycosyltransferase involved in cell wall biosynthesis